MIRRITHVVSLVGAVVLIRLLPTRSVMDDRVSSDHVSVRNVSMAISAYEMDFSVYPHGTNAEIMRALRGGNPRKAVYFEARDRDFNEKGELVDRWWTPYRIEPDASPRPRVSSVGKNKAFEGDAEGSDDIRSWQ